MLVKKHIPIHIALSNGVLSKGQKTFNSQIQQIEKLRIQLVAWEATTTAYHERYTLELTPLLLRPDEVLSRILHVLVLEVAQNVALVHTWTPTFAKLLFHDFEKVKIAAIHPDFV